MKVRNIAPDDEPGYYWWLPRCDMNKASNPNYWSIQRFGNGYCPDRVGLFIGPIELPMDFPESVQKFATENNPS